MRKTKRLALANKASFLMQVKACAESGASGSIRPVNPPKPVCRNMAPKGGFNARRCS